jgi:hypothetical protein
VLDDEVKERVQLNTARLVLRRPNAAQGARSDGGMTDSRDEGHECGGERESR